ncbi:MAG: class I SAM-dependent methyltransferase [Gemmatimonadetes bacterium]|nr:class I SAM-dependent methyltransferase [Gemmatimonadota bacterium]
MNMRELSKGLKASYRGSDVSRRTRKFEGWIGRASSGNDATDYDHTETVKEYYDLCGEFMVWGWGESLHFAPLSPEESVEESKVRHQRRMISKLEIRPGMTLIDVGCGIGGPMRRVVAETGASVVGINTNEIQIGKARSLSAEAGVDHMVDFVACSFMDMSSIADDTFDRGYAIESTCHAPDKADAFSEIYRVLKPGALFWGQEMCLTDEFDPNDERHRIIKRELMRGIALKHIETMEGVNRDLQSAGFQVIEATDLGVVGDAGGTPWYRPLQRRQDTPSGLLRRAPMGRKAIFAGSKLAELVGVFPRGASSVVRFMDRTAEAYVAGGATGIFTPLYCFLARKPS